MGISRRTSAVVAVVLSARLLQLPIAASADAPELRVAPAPSDPQTARSDEPTRIAPWPCRLIVKPTLLGVVDRGWRRSETLRQQCDTLAAARAVVLLEWDRPSSDWHARTQIGRHDGVVVARVAIAPVDDAIRLVAHELQHVIEQTGDVDYVAEATRPDSGVWRAVGGFETRAAIAAGERVWREVTSAPR